ncbi:MAG TPA: hypothetical protein VI524_08515, partial [Anaerolineales bacterium]|nr:hypothetical protein [Anaerolineales bacterium]
NTTGRVKPTSMKDINFGGQLTNAAWVDTITYNFFLSSSILAFDSNRTSAHGGLFAIAQPVEEFSERVAVIQGIFNPEGTELVNLEPAFRFPWPSQPTSLEQEGRFVAEVVDSEGGVTQVHFDALIHDDSEGEGKELTGFFEVMVPVSPNLEVVSIRITDAAGEQVFGELKSSQPPEIVIVAPEPGAQLGEQTEVAWEVQDPDTPLEELLYQVAYSPNGGENWVPIAVDVNGTENGITFDSTQIQESRENGVIRVFVSDGLNTAFADVDGLTTTAAQYPPP